MTLSGAEGPKLVCFCPSSLMSMRPPPLTAPSWLPAALTVRVGAPAACRPGALTPAFSGACQPPTTGAGGLGGRCPVPQPHPRIRTPYAKRGPLGLLHGDLRGQRPSAVLPRRPLLPLANPLETLAGQRRAEVLPLMKAGHGANGPAI